MWFWTHKNLDRGNFRLGFPSGRSGKRHVLSGTLWTYRLSVWDLNLGCLLFIEVIDDSISYIHPSDGAHCLSYGIHDTCNNRNSPTKQEPKCHCIVHMSPTYSSKCLQNTKNYTTCAPEKSPARLTVAGCWVQFLAQTNITSEPYAERVSWMRRIQLTNARKKRSYEEWSNSRPGLRTISKTSARNHDIYDKFTQDLGFPRNYLQV